MMFNLSSWHWIFLVPNLTFYGVWIYLTSYLDETIHLLLEVVLWCMHLQVIHREEEVGLTRRYHGGVAVLIGLLGHVDALILQEVEVKVDGIAFTVIRHPLECGLVPSLAHPTHIQGQAFVVVVLVLVGGPQSIDVVREVHLSERLLRLIDNQHALVVDVTMITHEVKAVDAVVLIQGLVICIYVRTSAILTQSSKLKELEVRSKWARVLFFRRQSTSLSVFLEFDCGWLPKLLKLPSNTTTFSLRVRASNIMAAPLD